MRKTKRIFWSREEGIVVGFPASIMPGAEPSALKVEDGVLVMRSLGMCAFVLNEEAFSGSQRGLIVFQQQRRRN